jgi:CheY-like chemotaxis protein
MVFGYGKHVLVVDDDQSARQETSLLLEGVGFIVVQSSDGLDALNDLQQQHFDAEVTDSHTPNLNGFELLAQSRIIRSDTPVIIVSKAQWDMSEMATTHGAFAWIRKSSDPGILLMMLALAVGGPGVGIPVRNGAGWCVGQSALGTRRTRSWAQEMYMQTRRF